jgi:hypothetical protein
LEKESYGYSIGIVDDSFPIGDEFTQVYNAIDESNASGIIETRHLFPKLLSLAILPPPDQNRNEEDEGVREPLYNILFTNYNTQDRNVPISSSPAYPRTGFNPPLGIQFSFDLVLKVTCLQLENILKMSKLQN